MTNTLWPTPDKENLCFLLDKFLALLTVVDCWLLTIVDCALLQLIILGVSEEKVSEKDVRQILIERYGDSIIYRSRKCNRVIQNSNEAGRM